MSFYNKHVFFCANQKDNGRKCCQMGDASTMCVYAKTRIKELGLAGEGGIRVSQSGCLGRCKAGPNIVVYPEGVWFTYETQADIDEIIESYLIGGLIPEHLLNNKEPESS